MNSSGSPGEFVRRQFLRLAFAATAGAVLAPGLAAAEPGADLGEYLSSRPGSGRFPLVAGGRAAPLVVSASDHPGVLRVVDDLQADLQRVTGVRPIVSVDDVPRQDDVVLVGTIGASPLIDGLISSGKLDTTGIAGAWETSLQQVVENPLPGVRRAFVIAGSDQRGTIFGAYEVSRSIGVSPWYWWADVPARHQDELYVLPGRHTQGTPVVKYRGLFINDENPVLGGWGPAYFGPGLGPGYPSGFNSKLYARVFELMLRLKANYLWPAVWGRAFALDDPENHATATKYGIVMGTSHEAPMMRGIEEWNRFAVNGHDPYGGNGQWSFVHNADAIKAYWRDGIRRMVEQNIEGVITIGMRGNGDTALPDQGGIELMQQIVAAQREIIAEVTGRDVTTIPQVWTLYKEVQRYWEEGMRAPDDVTVVFSDDNWGNIRKLPDPKLPPHPGGYGLYYHFDYVGGGRDYKWVDSSLIANTWEQLNLARSYGDSRLWVANVGDMKGNELPLQFFLDYAWNPDRWPIERLTEWEQRYAAENFGPELAAPIAELLHTYATLQSRRKPELLNRRITIDPTKDLSTDSSAVIYDDQATPFSLVDYQELDTVTAEWQALAARAEQLGKSLPAAWQDAYYEIVNYEIGASANLYAFRRAEFTNILYAAQGRAATNDLADEAEARFAQDLALADHYNTAVAGGKWKLWQTQPHIDYGDVARYGPNAPWQEPELNNWAIPDVIFPAIQRIQLPTAADMGVAIDGSANWWPAEPSSAVLPAFSPYQSQPAQYIDVFNRGQTPFGYQIHAAQPYVVVTPSHGTAGKQVRATVRVDWARAPLGATQVPITVTGPNGSSVEVMAVLSNQPGGQGFVEANGYVSIDADHYDNAVETAGISWRRLPDIGRTGAGMTPFPVTAESRTPGGAGPRLEYRMNLFTTGQATVWAYLSPRNNVLSSDGLHYAMSIDDEAPQLVNITVATGADDTAMNKQWERNTSDNVNLTSTTHLITRPGNHVLKFWMVDPTVVLQKIVVDLGGLRPSYLGPPESHRI
ncbi:MAG TPA: glycosyl hydrolase 115 family protein [Pseudonocardiaceae bacterium]|nr:glycosyl hydrolase 115 family protein [Pseudonocardiaceae bacterium]